MLAFAFDMGEFMNKDHKISFHICLTYFLIICIGILFNFAGKWIAVILRAPLWLDSIGTVFCACLFGPATGCLVGLLGFFLFSLLFPANLLYALSCIPISICASILYKKISFYDIFQLISAGILTALASIISLFLINIFSGNGIIENFWGDSLVSMLQQNGSKTYISLFIGYAFVDIPDKVLTLFIVQGMFYLKDIRKKHQER